MLRSRLFLAAGVLLLSASPALPADPPQTLPADLPPATVPAAANGLAVNLDSVLRLTFERNADILTARERVNESQIAFDAAMTSCMPEFLRKDTFKKPVAEATLWRRRAELRKIEHDNLQDAANSYVDWLTALRGEIVSRELLQLEKNLLDRARKLAAAEKPAQDIVLPIETAVTGREQNIMQTHQQGEAVAAKLVYLMGMDTRAQLTTTESLEPMDRVDTSISVQVLVRQAQENGPGVMELRGLIASIEQSIAQAGHAQSFCAHTGAALVCGRLQMAQSQLQQAQLSLFNSQLRLRAGVEEAFTAIVSGHEQLVLAAKVIDQAVQNYRRMELRLTEGPNANRPESFQAVQNSLRQLSQAHSNYLTAVRDYDKAQARLLLLLGPYGNPNCPASMH